MTSTTPIKMIVAGGGTGGHLYPGIAVAEALKELRPDSKVLFVGSQRPFEKQAVEKAGFSHKAIAVEGLKGRGILAKVKSLFMLAASIITALGIIIRFRPALILGVGGYASAPCMIAGFLLLRKIAIQEQNLIPGMANRWLGKLAGRAYVSFGQTMEHFAEHKVRVYGNPIRKSLVPDTKTKADSENSEDKPFTVMVVGGSQGAHAINEAVLGALSRLREPGKFALIHQTGEKDLGEAERAYKFWGGDAVVQAFFHDMGDRYSRADLVICRAGASTVAELTALGKACIFIPFPYAADNHQEYNARALEEAGAAEVILESALSGKVLADRILYYEENRLQLREMEDKARALGRPQAATAIVEDSLAWILKKAKRQ